MSYLQAENLKKEFADKVLFENITFVINEHERIALVAKNGTGKTSLMNIIAGEDGADEGTCLIQKDISYSYLMQDPVFDEELSLLDFLLSAKDPVTTAVREYENALITNNQKKIEEAILIIEQNDAWNYENNLKQILEKLKLTEFNKKISELSGGQRKRLALAEVIINKPDFLILDEPTNHLDFDMIEWLEKYLVKEKITLFVVTHDRYFLDNVCTKIFELDRGVLHVYNGNFTYFLSKRAERLEIEATETEKAKSFVKKESDWVNRMPKARGTKAKYRIEKYNQIKEKSLNKQDTKNVKISTAASRLGKKVIDFFNISKSFGNNVLLDDFSYQFIRLEKIGIIGNNGTGKTTFLNIITDNLKPDKGTIEIGETVKVGYYKQEGIDFNEDQRVIEYLKEIADVVKIGKNHQVSVTQFLEHFLFPASMHYNRIYKLSGGEKRRLYLMSILMQNPNFLILDEPTNDFDIMTLAILEDYLINFNGNVLFVSHDRNFTDNVADTIFVFEGNGTVSHFPGNYSAYKEFKDKQKAENRKTEEKKIKPKEVKLKSSVSNKMSYKEKTEFEALEKELESLNNEKQNLEEELSSGNLSPDELTEKSKRFNEIIELIDEKEFRWLELSEKE